MRKFSVWLALVIGALPSVSHALELRGNSTTILRLEQRDTPGFGKQNVYPATEFFGADVNKIGDDTLSFHAYGWGRVDLGDRSTSEGDTDGDLAYAYLLYRAPTGNGQAKIGRFYVYEGVAAEQLDGAAARVDLPAGFTLSAYGGAPVTPDQNSNNGDYLFGGRASYRIPSILELGVSALYEKSLANGPSANLKDYRGLVGGDIWLRPFRAFEIRGHTNFNYATSGIAEHGYRASFTPTKGLTIAAEYNLNRFKDLFASTNLRSLFNPDFGDRVTSYGGIVIYTVNKNVDISADYKRYNRDSEVATRQGNSNRYGAEVRVSLLENKSRSGIAYHRVDGTSGYINSYHEIHAYTLYDAKRYQASFDGIAHLYKEKISNEDRAYELIGSLGYKFNPGLVLSGDLSYGQNPRLNDDLRGVIRLTYNFTTHENQGAKK